MVKKRIAALAVMLLFLLAIGCGGREKKAAPEKQPAFPEARYLTAEGSGETEQEARRQALAGLSGVFESRVHAETHAYAYSAVGPDSGEFFEKTVESKVTVVSSVRLKGAKIGRTWQAETGSGTYHALAVIDRMQAGRSWADELDAVQARVTAQVANLEGLQGRFRRMAALNEVFSGLLQNQAIESRLRVLNYPARSALDVDIVAVSAELARLRSQLRFFIGLSGDEHQVAAARIADAFTSHDLLLGDDPGTADAVISGEIDIQPLKLNNPRAKFVRAAATVTVVETGSGATVTTLNESVRKGHADEKEAGSRAVLALADRLADRLIDSFGLGSLPAE